MGRVTAAVLFVRHTSEKGKPFYRSRSLFRKSRGHRVEAQETPAGM